MKLLAWSACLVAFAASLAFAASGQEDVLPDGIFVLNDAVVLFTTVHKVLSCSAQSQIPAVQIFISTDRGKTWTKRGPELEGSQFQYVYENEGRLWVAGEHTAEGPGSDPFVLVPQSAGLGWDLHYVYEGAAELESIAMVDAQHIVAWVRHLKLTGEGWVGPEYVHTSEDGGRTRRTLGRHRKRSDQPGQRFREIEKRSATWRVVDQREIGIIVQQQRERATWETVSQFPVHLCQE